MNNNFYSKTFLILILVSFSLVVNAENIKNLSEHEYNFYSKTF